MKEQATNLLAESIKSVITIGTVFFGGLLAFSSTVSQAKYEWSLYIALILLVLSCVTSILNLNSIVNKLYREEENAIKQNEVKKLAFLGGGFLLVGLVFSTIFIVSNNKDTADMVNGVQITDDNAKISTDGASDLKISKDPNSGKITEIVITPK